MILDSSAILSIVLGEDDAEMYLARMAGAKELGIGAPTQTECLISAHIRGGSEAARDVSGLVSDLECEVIPFTQAHTEIALRAFARFGKGQHPARLNLGDCYSYATATLAGRPLLFKGQDLEATDIGDARYSS